MTNSRTVLTCLVLTLPLVAETLPRLHSKIDDAQIFVLNGNTRPVIAQGLAEDEGAVPGSQMMPRLSIHFRPTAAQQADLEQLLAAQQDPSSAEYHKFLTPEEYAARFGMNTTDIAKVSAWLESSGFSNVQVARSQMWISFSGTAQQVQASFHVAIHNYSRNGETHFANTGDPQLPKALTGMVESIRGLDSFRQKPHSRRPQPRFTSSISGSTFLAPDDWQTIYDVKPLYGEGLDGSPINGQSYSIVVVGQSDVALSDIDAFRAASGLPAKDPTVIIPPGDTDPGFVSEDESESDLDLEWAGGIAKNANILFVTASATVDNGVEDSITYAIDNNVAPILSTSYGLCEADTGAASIATQNSLFAQANAQGMTIVAAAGDAGSADCDSGLNETAARHGLAVDFPASSPYVTGVGGTTLTASGAGPYFSSTNDGANGSALSYIPEKVWNDGFLAAGGGGASTQIAKPSWQAGVGVPNDGVRDVPDVAFAASPDTDGLLICGSGSCVNGFRMSNNNLDVIGGTSAGAPTLSGVLALLVQKTGTRLGNLNPRIYALAASLPSAFHDITAGNNFQACRTGSLNCPSSLQMGYSAGVGYDQASGWGSLDAFNFVSAFVSATQTISFPTIATQTAGTTLTLSASASSGLPVAFSSSTTNVCTVSGTTASFMAAGSCTITASQSGNGTYPAAALVSQTFTVLSAQTITFSPIASQIVGTSLTLNASASSGLAVSFNSSTTGVCTVSGDTATLIAAGGCTITASQAGNGTTYGPAQPVSQSFAVSITAPTALQFVPVTPCRVVDTRLANGPFGAPELAAGSTRNFNIPSSNCGIPSNAAAYSLNVTVVPDANLSYLSIWPSGQAQPVVSTLNSDGRIKANAAIVPAGTNGGVAVYVSDASQVILDISGYFVANNSSALAFYPLTPCRVVDTRLANGPLAGPYLNGGVARTFPIQSSSCNVPSTAQAYSLNFTAVPHSRLSFLTTWPAGQAQPNVSTLNSPGVVAANAALVPAGSSGAISVYVSEDSDVVIDTNGYFAPPATGGLSLYTVTPCRVLDTRTGSGAFNGTINVTVSPSSCAYAPTAQAFVLNATVVPPGPLSYLTLWQTGQTQPYVSTLNAPDGAITSNLAIVPSNGGSVSAFATDVTQLVLDLSAYFAP